MTVFDDLEATADSLVGAGAGGWVLGAVMVFVIMFPLALAIFMSKNAGTAGTIFVLSAAAFAVVFNVGVGWWESWSLVFIAVIILFGWWVSKTSGQGGGI